MSKRSDAEFVRIYGSWDRVEFVRWSPCVACGSTPCENAHTSSGGMGRKADAHTIVPPCPTHHRALHKIGAHKFAVQYLGADVGVDSTRLSDLAAMTEANWQVWKAK